MSLFGGIIAQPWMMNMYLSKSEYDIAVTKPKPAARYPSRWNHSPCKAHGSKMIGRDHIWWNKRTSCIHGKPLWSYPFLGIPLRSHRPIWHSSDRSLKRSEGLRAAQQRNQGGHNDQPITGRMSREQHYQATGAPPQNSYNNLVASGGGISFGRRPNPSYEVRT